MIGYIPPQTQSSGGSGGQTSDPDLTTIAAIDSTQVGVLASDGAGWLSKSYAALKTALGLTKDDVGLSNVDNTSDANKPVVHLTGNETVAGIKTFSSSPVVPTPTTSTQAANKTYVDTKTISKAGAYSMAQFVSGTTPLAETFSRRGGITSNTPSGFISGIIHATSIELLAGMAINNIVIESSTTAATTPTHYWFGLADSSYNVVALTADNTDSWGTFTVKNKALTSTYTVPTTGLYYVLCCVVASGMPNFICGPSSNNEANNKVPYIFFNDTTHTGLTTPATAPATLTPAGFTAGPGLYAQVL